MKLNRVEDPKEFLEVIDRCAGRVELITAEGDRLNLKSKLCQYVSLVRILSSADELLDLEIVAYEPEDIRRLMDYILKE